MRFLVIFLFSFLIVGILGDIKEPEPESDDEEGEDEDYEEDDVLEVVVTHKVENCQVRSDEGDTIYWKYEGTFLDGTEFDSGDFQAVLGAGHVIEGVDRAMRNMCVGEKRRMVIPPELAYGDEGYPGAIPPKATLVFNVEMTYIDQAKEPPHGEL